jgi:Ca-activated chloride channel family protein
MSRLTPRSLLLTALLIAAAAAPALSDGFIVVRPRRPSRPQTRNVPLAVKYHHVDVKIRDQVAITEIDQVFVNPNGWVLEGTYIFPLPDGASISKFSMFIDGKEVKAELLERDKAREIYEGIVRRMEDPALLEYVGRRMFKARIFPIPAHGEKRLKLSYSQVLTSSAGLVEYLYPLNTEKFSSKPLESCAVNVTISGGRTIQNVYSPTHPVDVVKKSDKTIRASYEAKNVKPDTDFRLYYSQDAKDFALNLVTHKPKGEDRTPRARCRTTTSWTRRGGRSASA